MHTTIAVPRYLDYSCQPVSSHKKTDPLFRGDGRDAVSVPSPGADPSLIRHILYLGGFGRETPYLSTSSDETIAARFAAAGRVWKTSGAQAELLGAKHLSQSELQATLKSSTKGRARSPSARHRLLARKYVELHAEHLIDFIPFKKTPATVEGTVLKMFEKA
jgi:hypothetical protein